MLYENKFREGFSYHGLPLTGIVFVLNTCKDKICQVSLVLQVLFTRTAEKQYAKRKKP